MRRRVDTPPSSGREGRGRDFPDGTVSACGGRTGRGRRTLRGSTLVETLVMMLVAGILFLAVMDGLTLFSRMAALRAEALAANRRQAEGLQRIADLAAAADSIAPIPFGLEVYRAGRRVEILLEDSTVRYVGDRFCDTLLTGVAAMRLCACAPQGDTLELRVEGFTVRFAAVIQPGVRYRTELSQIENGYGYEEK